MDTRANILSLLGLALRGNRLAVGEEPVEAVTRARDARVLLLAADAADNTRRRCRHFAEMGQCLYLTIPFTKAELGQAVGRSSAAVVALTDVGLAASLMHKLEALDPAKYGEAAERLDLKAKRAAERRAELEAHRKNLREGRCKPSKAPKASPKEQGQEPQAPGAGERPARKAGERPYRKPGQGGQGSKAPRRGGSPQGHWAGKGGKRPTGAGSGHSPKGRGPKSKYKANPYANSRPVKKGKGSFRKQAD